MKIHANTPFSIPAALLAALVMLFLGACQTTDTKRTNLATLDTSSPFVIGYMVTYHDYCEHYFLDGADVQKVQALKDEYEGNDAYEKGYAKYRNALHGDYSSGPNRCGEVKEFFDLAYVGKNNSKNAKSAAIGRAERYFMKLTWENVLSEPKVISVFVRQGGGKGYAKASTRIGGKDCKAAFYYKKDGSGTWSLDCKDGSKAIGNLQLQKGGEGSVGSGADADGNRIEFETSRKFFKAES